MNDQFDQYMAEVGHKILDLELDLENMINQYYEDVPFSGAMRWLTLNTLNRQTNPNTPGGFPGTVSMSLSLLLDA